MHSKIPGRIVILVGEDTEVNAELVRQIVCEHTKNGMFVTILTTRPPHVNDWPGSHHYVTRKEFNMAESIGSFVLHYAHDGHAYGIRMYDLTTALDEGTVVLTLPHDQAETLRGMVDHAYVVPVAATPANLNPDAAAVDQLTDLLSRLSR